MAVYSLVPKVDSRRKSAGLCVAIAGTAASDWNANEGNTVVAVGRNPVTYALVNEFVVDDRCGQQAWDGVRLILFALRFLLLQVLGADDATLAQHIAVLLAGDLLWHFKYHLDESIHRQLLWSMKQQPGLTQIIDCAFIPSTGVIDAKTKRHVQLQAAGAGCPGRAFFSRMITPNGGFRLTMLHALSAAHGSPVILVFGCAQQTDLIIVSVRTAARPGEFVGATPEHKNIHDFLRHDGYFRT